MKNSFHNPTSTSPTLSIVIPFFNKKILTGKMIDSIIANKFTSWELLAIDDGSSQETLEYLKKYEVYDNIQIIHRNIEPKGAQTCRNIGLQKARGEYIVFFDSEGHYQQMMYVIFSILDNYVDVEVRTPSGRVDMVLRSVRL